MATLDLILFGATGFTGKLCMRHIIENYCNDKYSFKFGLAARNMDKLRCTLNGFQQIDENKKETYFELIECDSFNDKQLNAMISKTKVIITTVGPYCVYGEKLIKICSENGCDYIDLTGEFHWVQNMINKYQQTAINSKSRIINIAGELAALSDVCVYNAINKLINHNHNDNDDAKGNNDNFKIKNMLEPPSNAKESGGSLSSILNMYKQGAFNNYYDNKFSYTLCPKDNLYQNTQKKWSSIFPKWNEQIKRYEIGLGLAGELCDNFFFFFKLIQIFIYFYYDHYHSKIIMNKYKFVLILKKN